MLNTIGATNLAEYSEILLLLGDPPATLRGAFLDWHSRQLRGFVAQCRRALDADADDASFALGPGRRPLAQLAMHDFVREMNRRFMHDVLRVCATYEKLFGAEGGGARADSAKSALTAFGALLFEEYLQVMELRLLRDVAAAAAAATTAEGRGAGSDAQTVARAYRVFGEALQALRIGVRPFYLPLHCTRIVLTI